MRARKTKILSALATTFAVLVWLPAAAEKVPSFEQVYRSNDVHNLTAWGRRYEHGVGIGQDVGKAVRLYCKAARKGDVEAQFNLGQIYAFGRGIERNRELAAAWLYKAAQGDDRRASSLLHLLKVKGKPKRRASCPLGTGGTRIATRQHPASGEVAKLVRSLAPRYALDPNLVLAVVETESNFNAKAVSPKNAQGLMQLIPATAERFGVRDVWDPEQNLRGGMAYLRWLLDRFDGDVELALAGYNAGEKAVERHGGIPPYAETQAYVKRIVARIN
ncbi:MAG: transglycosylase SLT domain-containing protein [Pseudomonadota bacterium]|nr:transglycosylase SLT domain-containing protein [Pseudomonadota bacterium]